MLEKSFLHIVKKALLNPEIAIFKCVRLIYSFFLFPFNCIRYNHFGIFSYISPSSSINNKSNICIGKNVEVNQNCTLWPLLLVIDDYVQINPGTVIYGRVVIGKCTMIGPNCNIIGGNHNSSDINIPIRYQGSSEKGITIGNNVWIGAGVSILDGVTISDGAIVGAGSVVTKNVSRNCIVVGNPATILRERI
jgi:acetyltransferase-like isoleucine patch superfamily enzyme